MVIVYTTAAANVAADDLRRDSKTLSFPNQKIPVLFASTHFLHRCSSLNSSKSGVPLRMAIVSYFPNSIKIFL
jgi:hypothetical protein